MKRRDELLVGLLLVFAAVVGVLGTVWLVRGGLTSGYDLYARFPWGAGLKQGQPVQLAGVDVGYVAEARLDPNGTIVVRMAIEDEYGIPVNTTATVVPVGIFGDVAIALTPERATTQYLPAGDTVPVGAGSPTTAELLGRADSIGRSVGALTTEFERQLVTDGGIADLRRALATTNALMAESQALIRQVSGIAAEQSRQLTATMGTARRSLAALDSATIDSTMRNLRATSANAEALTTDLRTTTTQLNSVLAALQSDTAGTAGRLLHDPTLYHDIRRLTARIDSLTADFQRNPRRYVNLSIF